MICRVAADQGGHAGNLLRPERAQSHASRVHHKLGFGTAPGQTPDYLFGLKDVFTPFSSGKINITRQTPTSCKRFRCGWRHGQAIVNRRAGSGIWRTWNCFKTSNNCPSSA